MHTLNMETCIKTVQKCGSMNCSWTSLVAGFCLPSCWCTVIPRSVFAQMLPSLCFKSSKLSEEVLPFPLGDYFVAAYIPLSQVFSSLSPCPVFPLKIVPFVLSGWMWPSNDCRLSLHFHLLKTVLSSPFLDHEKMIQEGDSLQLILSGLPRRWGARSGPEETGIKAGHFWGGGGSRFGNLRERCGHIRMGNKEWVCPLEWRAGFPWVYLSCKQEGNT